MNSLSYRLCFTSKSFLSHESFCTFFKSIFSPAISVVCKTLQLCSFPKNSSLSWWCCFSPFERLISGYNLCVFLITFNALSYSKLLLMVSNSLRFKGKYSPLHCQSSGRLQSFSGELNRHPEHTYSLTIATG